MDETTSVPSMESTGVAGFIIGGLLGGVLALLMRRSQKRYREIAERLFDSEQELRALSNAAFEGVAVHLVGKILQTNHTLSEMTGYPPSELVGLTIYDIVHPEFHDEILRRIVASSEEPYEVAVVRKDGSIFPAELRGRTITYRGQRARVIAIRDITRQKESERELADARRQAEGAAARESEARATLEAILNTAPVGIIVAAAKDMGIIYYSPEVVRIFGEPPLGNAAIPEPGTYMLLHSDSSPFSPDELLLPRSLRYGEVSSNVEMIVRRRDGSEVTVLISSAPIRNAEGRITAAVATLDDITELAELRNTLTRQVSLLQRALVPGEPSICYGYSAASAYQPAYEGEEIGGDFYDTFTTSKNKIAILIGDVAGKGIEAAALASATRSTIRAFAYESASAGDAISRANAVLYSQQPDFGAFVTVFLLILEPESGEFHYAVAGHPPPAIYRSNGSIQFLACCDKPPVGLLTDGSFTEYEDQLGVGDKVILYTDGITEARQEANLFGTEGIFRTLQEHGSKELGELIRKLMDAARNWAGGAISDDAAIIAIERNS